MKIFLASMLLPAALSISNTGKAQSADTPAPFIQLQRIEIEEEEQKTVLKLSYNEEDQLSRVEIMGREEKYVQRYINYTYVNGLPVKAESFLKTGNTFRKQQEVHFKINGMNRITCVARGTMNANGRMEWGDTTDYSFNAANKLISASSRTDEDAVHNFSYDGSGNYMLAGSNQKVDNDIFDNKYEFSYDVQPNPFSVNDLGIMLYSVFGSDPFDHYQLFSSNNPVQVKDLYTATTLNPDKQPASTFHRFTITEYQNKKLDNGTRMQVLRKISAGIRENGKTVSGSTTQTIFTFTCLKKEHHKKQTL